MNWSSIRSLFPAAERYTYLNTAGCGLMSVRTAQRAKDYYDEFLVHCGNNREKWMQDSERARALAAGLINGSPNELAFAPDVATAMNHVARMFRQTMNVLMVSNDFPSLNLPWLAADHNLVLVGPEEDGSIDINRIADSITPSIRILCISHVHFDTGYRNDIEELGKLCTEKKILFIVDTTQSLGAFPVDVKKMHIDILVSNCYKWITAGFGITILYVSEEVMSNWKIPALGSYSTMTPPVASIRQNIGNLKKGASVLEIGQPGFENIYRLESAIGLLNEAGLSNIHLRVMELARYLYTQLERQGITVHFPYRKEQRSALVMAQGDMDTVTRLKEKNIIVTPSRGKGIRISPHFYNTEKDIDILCEELSILQRGAT
jgi:cysteine desulfurase / selenocysteine lyase